MKSKKIISVFMAITLLIVSMMGINVFAEQVDEVDDDWNVIELVINDDGTIKAVQPRNSSFVQTVTSLPEEFGGEAWSATNSKLTVSGKASNVGSTVSIHLRKKGLLNQYYKVSGTDVTLACDGQTHNLYSGISITAGETYKFYYKSNGGNTHTPSVTLGVVLWD